MTRLYFHSSTLDSCWGLINCSEFLVNSNIRFQIRFNGVNSFYSFTKPNYFTHGWDNSNTGDRYSEEYVQLLERL